MDDIVTRLRKGFELKQGDFRDLLKAADEIERLRAELQLAHSQIAIIATAKVEEEPF